MDPEQRLNRRSVTLRGYSLFRWRPGFDRHGHHVAGGGISLVLFEPESGHHTHVASGVPTRKRMGSVRRQSSVLGILIQLCERRGVAADHHQIRRRILRPLDVAVRGPPEHRQVETESAQKVRTEGHVQPRKELSEDSEVASYHLSGTFTLGVAI